MAEPKGIFLRTAFFIDGGFFLKRLQRVYGSQSPRQAALILHKICLDHLIAPRRSTQGGPAVSELYRIFYYDCLPLNKKVHNPVTKRAIDFGRSPLADWRLNFLEELTKLRKVAIRRGYLAEGGWNFQPDVVKKLLRGTMRLDEVTESDVKYEVRQKGVDMRLGLDIASLSFKRLVEQIVLVAGDSDFVPAAKLARREGIDFILDPMWAPIRADLHEHIDGLRSVVPRPGRATNGDEMTGDERMDE